jgi:hypothetical protein
MKGWQIVMLAIHDHVLGIRRREVYRWEQGEWVFKGLQ